MVAWNTKDARVAIVAGARTPFVKMGGALRNVPVADLAKVAFQETLYRAHWASERLDEVILGNVVMPADATNPARVAAIFAGVPWRVPAMTVQRNCASGMEAIADAAAQVLVRSGLVPALVPVDAALHAGRLDRGVLSRALDERCTTPRLRLRGEALVRRADPGCESVGETLTRALLVDAELDVRSQVDIRDGSGFVGRVDLLVAGRVVVVRAHAGDGAGLGLAVAVVDREPHRLAEGADHLGVERLAGRDQTAQ